MTKTNAADGMPQFNLRQPYITMDYSKPPKGFYCSALGGVWSQLKLKSPEELMLGDQYPQFLTMMKEIEEAKAKAEEAHRKQPTNKNYKVIAIFPENLGNVKMFKENLGKIPEAKKQTTKEKNSTLITYTNPQGEVIGTIRKEGQEITATAGNRTCYAPKGKDFEECKDITPSGNKITEILENKMWDHLVEIKEPENPKE